MLLAAADDYRLTNISDLLKRHVANHSSENSRKRSKVQSTRQSRVGQACEECSKSHLRCEDEKPCRRCRQKNLECRLSSTSQDGMDDAQELDAAQDLLDLSNALDPQPPSPPMVQSRMDFDHAQTTVSEAPVVAPKQTSPSWHQVQDMNPNFANPTLIPTQDGDSLPLFMQDAAMSFGESSPGDACMPDFLRHMPVLETSLSGHATPWGIVDPSFHWDLDFSSFDFGLFDQGNMHEYAQPETSSTAAQTTEHHPQPRNPDTAAADRAKAFDRSLWRYLPRSKTNPVTAGESNLTFPDGESEAQSPSCIPVRNITSERLSYTVRDRLLALYVSTVRRPRMFYSFYEDISSSLKTWSRLIIVF